MIRLVGLLVALAAASPLSTPQTTTGGYSNGVCTVSESVQDRPPDDPHASPYPSAPATWYANQGRTIWAWWWGKGANGYKVLWVRPAGAKVTVTGRRLDAEAPPLTADIPDGYPYSFQASGLHFPTSGCWQVDGSAGGQSLRFVVKID